MNPRSDEERQVEFDAALFFASAHRPKLLDGCDRSLLALNVLGSILIVYAYVTLTSLIISVLFFFTVRFWLRHMGKKDPLAVRVFLRSIGYRAFYGARTKYAAVRIRATKWVSAG